MKAVVKLTWTLSPSSDISRREVEVQTSSGIVKADVPLGVSEFRFTAESDSTLVFKTRVFDPTGNVAESQSLTFVVPDLEAPLPDTDLVAVVESIVPGEPPV